MVTFIEYGGNFVPKHPCRSQRLRAFLFGIRGERAKMQALCDKTLNVRDVGGKTRGAVRYEVISDFLIMAFMDMQLVSLHPADTNEGALREKECTFVIPLLAWNEFQPPRLVFYMPYLWLNSGVPLIVGREIYGFPKHFGRIDMPGALGEPASWQLYADVLRQFAPAEVCDPRLIVTVARAGGGNLEAEREMAGTEDVFETVLAALGLPVVSGTKEFFETVLATLGLPDLSGTQGWMPKLADTRLVFLKQFRDHEDAERACFQAVLEAPVSFPAFFDAQVLSGAFDAQFFNYASAPLMDDLGLAGGAGTQRALFAARANLTFDLGLGETQWAAT